MKIELLTIARDTESLGQRKQLSKKEDKVIIFVMLNQFWEDMKNADDFFMRYDKHILDG